MRRLTMLGAAAIVLSSCASATPTAAPSTVPPATLDLAGPSQTPEPSTPRPTQPSAPATGTWTATGAMITARAQFTATLLSNGKVLVAGGKADTTDMLELASAELYDPSTGTWSLTGPMSTPRSQHTATLLANGKVLVAGGFCAPLGPGGGSTRGCPAAQDPNGAIATAELYDPQTGKWSPTGGMTTERFDHTATLLADGKVLVAGAEHRSGILASTELYDPSTGKWRAAGSMITARWQHFAVKLSDGKVLVFGGCCDRAGPSAELYDPDTGTWTATGDLITGRAQQGTAALLADGSVLVAGGDPGGTDCGDPMLASAELYDPGSGMWSSTTPLSGPRVESSSTLLADGRVFVVGGFDAPCTGEILASAELFDPGSGSWIGAGGTSAGRFDLAATLLANGQVLVTGGIDHDGVTASTELYDPGP